MVLGIALIGIALGVGVALTWLAHRDLNRPEPPTPPCSHPWFIDGRCMVCGTPK